MTQPAGDSHVPAQEWVFGQLGVVERRDGGPPVLFVVAGRAFLAEFTLVDVVRLVAPDAPGLGLAMQLVRAMAMTAGRSLMSSVQWKVGKTMVEGVFVEQDNIGAAPLVVCVTADAVRLHDIRGLAVKADSSLQVLRDILVAVEAQGVLLGLRKGHMAAAAVGLKLRMTSDYRPRHHEFLDLEGVNVRGNCQRQEDEYCPQPWPGKVR